MTHALRKLWTSGVNLKSLNNLNKLSLNHAELMLPREEKYIYDWEMRRSQGKWLYIVLNSIIWSILLSVIIKLFKIVLSTKFSIAAFSQTFFNISFLFFWLKFLAGVFIYTLLIWHLSYKKYKALKEKQMLQRLTESDRLVESQINRFSGHL